MHRIVLNYRSDALNYLWGLFTDGKKELFTTNSYGLCFTDKGWRTVRAHRLERRHFNAHFLGFGNGDIGVMVPWRSRWFRIDIDNHRRGPVNDRKFLTKVVTLYDQLLRYGAPEVDGVPATWTLEVKRTLTGAHFDLFFHRPLFTALLYPPEQGRTRGLEMECGNELLKSFLEVTDRIFQTNVFSGLELPVSKKNCRLPFGRDYQLILDDIYDQCPYQCFEDWAKDQRGHLSTKDLLRYSVLGDIFHVRPSDHYVLTCSLPYAPILESGENIYMSSTDLKAESISSLDRKLRDKSRSKKSLKSGGMWSRLTSFWKGELPLKQYENDHSDDKLSRTICETYKILRFENLSRDNTVLVLNNLIDDLPEKCRRSDFFKDGYPERVLKIENVTFQTEKWLDKHPEAEEQLKQVSRHFTRTGRLISRKETWSGQGYHDDYSRYQVRKLPSEIVEKIGSFRYGSGHRGRSFPQELANRVPELVSYVCNVARKRGARGEPTGLQLIKRLVFQEFGVGLHQGIASWFVNYLIDNGYLVLLKDYVKKKHGRTLGIGEAFKALPFK